MNILHISFHKGCQNDIEYICNKLGHNLKFMEFDDGETTTNAKYNISHERASKCWNKYKDYFNSFDIIITSDTCPISRVFLQHNYEKKLIIWICNRFDYYDSESLDCNFPDEEYYNLIKNAKTKKNIVIAGYTQFENYYAKNIKNIDIGDLIIKPIGKISKIYDNLNKTILNNKKNLYVVPQYHNETIMMNLSEKLKELNILNYNGRYNGPLDLQEFKGVIHIPYAWSNLALFESIHLGIQYFIPSINFLCEIKKDKNFWFQPPFNVDMLNLSEWYSTDNQEIFVYFDSWEDLIYKINIDRDKEILINFGKNHETKYLNMWEKIITHYS